MTALNLALATAPTPEEAARASAQAILDDLGKQVEAIARRQASRANKIQTLRNELRAISPTIGPDNLVIDPADDNSTLRSRRPELRRAIEELERENSVDIDLRRELEPKLDEARLAYRLADVECRKTSFRQIVAAAIESVSRMRNDIWVLYTQREALAREFPQHEFPAPGVTIPAHLRAPAVPRNIVDSLMGLSNLLLESLASWDPTLFDVQSPERQRVERIASAEKHAADAGDAVHRKRIEQLRAEEAKRAAGARNAAPTPKSHDIFDAMRENDASIAARAAGHK